MKSSASHRATIDPPPEPVRNRLLRRVDWRFLLPNPQPERAICFANGALARAVELISRETVPASAKPSGNCDLRWWRGPRNARCVLLAPRFLPKASAAPNGSCQCRAARDASSARWKQRDSQRFAATGLGLGLRGGERASGYHCKRAAHSIISFPAGQSRVRFCGAYSPPPLCGHGN